MCACGGSGGTNERRVHDMRGAHEIRHARLAALRLDCGRPHGSRSHGPRSVGGVHRPGDKATPATAEARGPEGRGSDLQSWALKVWGPYVLTSCATRGPEARFFQIPIPNNYYQWSCVCHVDLCPPPPKKRPRGTQLHQSEPGLDPAPSAWASWVVPGRDYYSRNTP